MSGFIMIAAILVLVALPFYLRNKKADASTKTCAYCGSKIPYGARVCPACRRDPGNGTFREQGRVEGGSALRTVLWALLIILVLTALAYFGILKF